MEQYLIIYENDSFFYTVAVDLKDCIVQFAADIGADSSLLSKALKGMETVEEIINLFNIFSMTTINKIVKVEKILYG